jgi:uncharacterized protein (TIRG00374 family)
MSVRTRRLLRVAGLLVILAIAAATLRGRLPNIGQLAGALRTAHPGWLVLAVAAEATSMRHFALQQRRLLAGFGVDMSFPRALAVTYSRSAMSISLPAGSAVSAGFAFRQFRTVGAGRRVATAVMVLSALLTAVALLLMYLLVAFLPAVAGTDDNSTTATAVAVVSSLVVAALVFAADWLVSRRGQWLSRTGQPAQAILDEDNADSADEPVVGRWNQLVVVMHRTIATLRSLPPQAWVASLVHATVNWATDFACLASTAAAFDLHIGVMRLATVYVTVQLVRQIPISPGGIGVIEVSLLAGLVSAGAHQTPAAAAMLVYRLISCWLIIPLGALAYAGLRGGRQRSAAPEMAASQRDLGRHS